jgi:hypothetical protein
MARRQVHRCRRRRFGTRLLQSAFLTFVSTVHVVRLALGVAPHGAELPLRFQQHGDHHTVGAECRSRAGEAQVRALDLPLESFSFLGGGAEEVLDSHAVVPEGYWLARVHEVRSHWPRSYGAQVAAI